MDVIYKEMHVVNLVVNCWLRFIRYIYYLLYNIIMKRRLDGFCIIVPELLFHED